MLIHARSAGTQWCTKEMHANSLGHANDAAHEWSKAIKKASQNVEQSTSHPKQSRKPPRTY